MRNAHISVRILLVPFIAMLILCGFVSVMTIIITRHHNAKTIYNETNGAVIHLSKLVEKSYLSGSLEKDEVFQYVVFEEMVADHHHVESCAIINTSFQYIVHSNRKLNSQKVEDPKIIALLEKIGTSDLSSLSETIVMNGVESEVAVAAVKSGKNVIAYTLAISSSSDRTNYSRIIAVVLFLAVGVFVLTASMMIFRESIYVVSPLKEINIAVRKLAEEGGAEKIHYDSGGDLGELIDSFNSLIDKWKILYEKTLQIQKETNEQKQLSDAVVDNIANGIIVLDSELNIQKANRTVEINLDLSSREIIGKKFYEAIPGWENENSETVVRNVIEKDEVYYNERIYMSREDSARRTVFNINICPIRDSDNNSRGAVVLFEFLTDKVLLEEHLLRTNEELKHANDIKSEFLSMVSHELRTPLTLIKMYSSMMDSRRMGPLNEQQGKAVEVIHRRCRNLHELIDDLLDLSKIESGHLEFHIQEVSIYEIINDLEETHLSRAEEKELKLIFDTEPGMPKILADKDKLFRVINNLIENSMKFTECGSIQITATKDPNNSRQALVRVSDTGCGIPEDCTGKVFDKFFQGDGSDTRKYGGSGLGLSIAQEIAALHHGRLWLESSVEGEGSTFALTIPFTHPEMISLLSNRQIYTGESGVKEASRQNIDKSNIQSKSGNNVLLIDDDNDFIDMITDILTEDNYIVHSALSGIKGLEILFSDTPVDVILLDVSMNNLSGYEMCRMIKAVESKESIPVLMLTAFGMSDQIKNGYEAGAAGYLVKPFTIESFKETLERVMGGNENAT